MPLIDRHTNTAGNSVTGNWGGAAVVPTVSTRRLSAASGEITVAESNFTSAYQSADAVQLPTRRGRGGSRPLDWEARSRAAPPTVAKARLVVVCEQNAGDEGSVSGSDRFAAQC